MNITSKIPFIRKMQQNTAVAKTQKVYTETCDVFEKKDCIMDAARNFREKVLNAFCEWEDSAFPRDNEEGSSYLKSQLAPYISFIDKLKSKEAERFTKLVFGENQLKSIEQGAKVNSDVRLLKDTLEEKMGKSIKDVIIH